MAHTFHFKVQSRSHDNTGLFRFGIRPYLIDDIQTIDGWKMHVEEQHVGLVDLYSIEDIILDIQRYDLIPLHTEQRLQ